MLTTYQGPNRISRSTVRINSSAKHCTAVDKIEKSRKSRKETEREREKKREIERERERDREVKRRETSEGE